MAAKGQSNKVDSISNEIALRFFNRVIRSAKFVLVNSVETSFLGEAIMNDDSLHQSWQDNAAAQRARFADYALDPAHTIDLETHSGHARVLWKGKAIAESANALKLLELKHAAVYYFPQDDVRTDLLVRTDHATHCPYKGDASYWSLRDGDAEAENAVWAYESPIDAVGGIKDLMAFYLDDMGKDFGLILETD